MLRLRNATAWLLLGMLSLTSVARAEPPDPRDSLADAWVHEAVASERSFDVMGRYVGAPSAVLLGVGSMLLPAAVDLSAPAAAAYVTSGALMLTAAIGMWAHADAREARRWYGMSGSLGFVALGAGLLLSCAERDDGCGAKPVTRNLQIGVGIADAGFFASGLLASLLMPLPSASELELSVRDLNDAERTTRVLEFLERRDRVRRVSSYVAAPWGMVLGGVLLANAHDAATPAGEALLYVQGGVLLGVTIAGLLYEQFRKPDAQRLREGRRPE